MGGTGARLPRATFVGAITVRLKSVFCAALAFLAVESLGAQTRNDDLYNSIHAGGVSDLQLALSAGMDPNTKLVNPDYDMAESLLEVSFRAKNDEAVLELLRHGADTELGLDSSYYTFFEIVAALGLTRSLEALIRRDPAQLVSTNGDALIYAIEAAQVEAVDILLTNMLALTPEYDLYPILNQALRVAISADAGSEMMDRLLLSGADPTESFALFAAVIRCSPANVEYVLSKGVDPNERYEGKHVAAYALECFQYGDPETSEAVVASVVALLASAGSDVCTVASREVPDLDGARIVLEDHELCPF